MDDTDKEFLEELKKIEDDLLAAAKNENSTSDAIESPNLDTRGPVSQLNSSLEVDRNCSTTATPITPTIIQSTRVSLDTSSSHSHVIHQQSILDVSEESRVLSFEASGGGFLEAEDNQWNLSEIFSSQDNSVGNGIQVPQTNRKYMGFEGDRNFFRAAEIPPEMFLGKQRSSIDSMTSSPTCRKGEENETNWQKTNDYRKIKDILGKFPQRGDSSPSERAASSAASGSVAAVDVVSVAGPSAIPAEPREIGKKKRFACNVCGKILSTKQNLRRHQAIHTRDKLFEGLTCAKGFARKDDLKSHELSHKGKKSFACHICNKAFAHKRTLTTHLRTHSEEKPHQCRVCVKGFYRKPDFDLHLLTHTGDKPHQCNICSRRFSKKGNLTRHLRTHSGEKPFTCEFCGKKFTRKSSRNRHQKIRHGGI